MDQLLRPSLQKLREELLQQPEIMSYQSDPKFCSFLTCVGLQLEIENSKLDRLSAPLGVPTGNLNASLILKDGFFGIVLKKKDNSEFRPDNRGLKDLMDPYSLDENGLLTRVIFFPEKIANTFAKKGIELVIVKQWVLTNYNYQLITEVEMNTNSALLQAQVLSSKRLAFSGTHDLADHLLNFSSQDFLANLNLFKKARKIMEKYKHSKLLIYTMGIVLDDLAQPAWYKSQIHIQRLNWLMGLAKQSDIKFDLNGFVSQMRFVKAQ